MRNDTLSIWFKRIVFYGIVISVGTFLQTGASLAQDVVAFNYTVSLSWNDYQHTVNNHDLNVWGDGWPSCISRDRTKRYTDNIPFEQTVFLTHTSSGQCERTRAMYRLSGGAWTEFITEASVEYAGDLDLELYVEATGTNYGDCLLNSDRRCDGDIDVAFYGETTTTSQFQRLGPYNTAIAVNPGKKELLRIPAPNSQFYDSTISSEGAIDAMLCDVTTDTPSKIMTWCELEGETFVIYARSKAPDIIEFNYTTTLSWKYYKRQTREYNTSVTGEGWPSCASKDKTRVYSVPIPFSQNVSVHRSYEGECERVETKYRVEGGTWTEYAEETSLDYPENLELQVYIEALEMDFGTCTTEAHRECFGTAKATFHDETPTSNQSQESGPHPVLILATSEKQQVGRIPVPLSQVDDIVIREQMCQVTTDKPASVEVLCERVGEEFMIYAQLK